MTRLQSLSWDSDFERVLCPDSLPLLVGGQTVNLLIRADFPKVTPEALKAVVTFAAASAEEDLSRPQIPAAA